MADLKKLQDALDKLTVQVAKNETVEASAKALILGQGEATKVAVAEAVTKALADDNATDEQKAADIAAAVDGVTERFAASADDLGGALVAPQTPPAA